MNDYKSKIPPLLVMLCGLIVMGCLIRVVVQYPFIGIDVKKQDNQFVIKKVSQTGWSKEHGITIGDIVLSIDDRKPDLHFTIKKHNTIEKAHAIELLHENKTYRYIIKYNGVDRYFIYHLVFPVIFYLCCLSLCCFLIMRKQNNPTITLLIYFLNVLGLTLLSAGASARKDSLGKAIMDFTIVFSIVLLFDLVRRYFSNWKLQFINKVFVYSLYVIGFIAFICSVLFQNSDIIQLFPPELIFFVSVFLILNILLIKKYFHYRQTEYKHSILILMTGIYVSLIPFIMLFAVPKIILNQPIMPAELTTMFIILLPLCLFYLVVAQELIDMTFVIRKFYYCGAISFVATSAILTSFLLITKSNVLDNSMEIVRLSLIIFTITFGILYVKDHLDFLLRKILYPKQREYQLSLNRFLHTMKAETNFKNLLIGLQKEIESHLPVTKTTLIQINEDHKIVSNLDGKQIAVPLLDPTIFQNLNNIGAIQKLPNGFFVLLSDRDGQYLVLIGEWKTPIKKLNTSEMIWLETILNYTQVMIENLYKIEEVIKRLGNLESDKPIPLSLSKLLLSISEKERKSLARDLHDTILQDQLSLARKIGDEITQYNDPNQVQFLNSIRENLLDYAYSIREVSNELHPVVLHELGLHQSLSMLFEKVNLESNFLFYSHIEKNIALLDKGDELAIYRIIQELLNNAMKHSEASEVSLKLIRKGNQIILSYQDNGIGCSIQNSFIFGTRGLAGIRERVRGLDGDVKIVSKKGKGFKADITFESTLSVSYALI